MSSTGVFRSWWADVKKHGSHQVVSIADECFVNKAVKFSYPVTGKTRDLYLLFTFFWNVCSRSNEVVLLARLWLHSKYLTFPDARPWSFPGPQQVDIFGNWHDCDLLLYYSAVATKHIFENFSGKAIAQLPPPWLQACLRVANNFLTGKAVKGWQR